MDEIVARAMLKWPSVPNVYGWLRLDGRGNWLVKTRAAAFERIGNPAVIEFIGRNYGADDLGRWFFQNGPQRVYVILDYTPWVFRLSDSANSLVAHTGNDSGFLKSLFLDEAGTLLVEAALGVGTINDRDLTVFVDQIAGENPILEGGEALQTLAASPTPRRLQWFGQNVLLGSVQRRQVAGRFGFEPNPVAPAGEPDC